jgi:hypothetical protein
METVLAGLNVARDALPLTRFAQVALKAELLEVKFPAVLFKPYVFRLEPDLIDPVDAYYMDPFQAFQTNKGAAFVRTERAVWRRTDSWVLHEEGAARTVPGLVVIVHLLVEVSAITVLVHDHQTQLALDHVVVFLVHFANTNVAAPVLLVFVGLGHDRGKFASDQKSVLAQFRARKSCA